MSLTYTLLDNLECEGFIIRGKIHGEEGVETFFNANDNNISCQYLEVVSNPGEGDLTVFMGSGIWQTQTFVIENEWNYKEVIIEPGASTIRLFGEDSEFLTVGEHSFHNIEIKKDSEVSFGTTATFNKVKISPGATVDLGTSQIDIASLQAIGTSDNLISITGGTLSKPSGFVQCDYLNLTNSTATGGAMWYAGEHSIDNGGNVGWRFGKKRKYPLPARPWKA